MSIGVWYAGLLSMLIGIAAAVAGAVWKRRQTSREIYKGHTTGRVVELHLLPDRSGRSGYHDCYYPVVEYYAQGLLFRSELSEGSWPSRYAVNDEVAVCFDPADPDLWEIEEKKKTSYLPDLLSAAGYLLILVSVICMLAYTSSGH